MIVGIFIIILLEKIKVFGYGVKLFVLIYIILFDYVKKFEKKCIICDKVNLVI